MCYFKMQQEIFYMPTNRTVHIITFVTPVLEHWLECEIIAHEGSIWWFIALEQTLYLGVTSPSFSLTVSMWCDLNTTHSNRTCTFQWAGRAVRAGCRWSGRWWGMCARTWGPRTCGRWGARSACAAGLPWWPDSPPSGPGSPRTQCCHPSPRRQTWNRKEGRKCFI